GANPTGRRLPCHGQEKGSVVNRTLILTIVGLLGFVGTASAQLTVVSHDPTLNENADKTATVSVTFDRGLDTSTVTHPTFRRFGRGSGTASGALAFSNGDKTVTLTPDHPFSAGEFVFVNLSHDITADDDSTLRSQGYAFQFTIKTAPAPATFQNI